MNNKFDMLAKVALNEASLGSYIKAAARTAGRAVGTTVKAAGTVYSALGGEKGGSLLQKAGAGLQKISSPSEVFALQRKKALPSKGDNLSLLTPQLNGVERFTVTDVSAGKKSGINITAKPQGSASNKFNKIIISASGENGLQSGSATITFYNGNTLSTLQPVQASAKRTDIGGANTWQLSSTGVRQKNAKSQQSTNSKKRKTGDDTAANSETPPQRPEPTPSTKKAEQSATTTKAGTPVGKPTKADVASMNLPGHPLTSKTPPNRPRK